MDTHEKKIDLYQLTLSTIILAMTKVESNSKKGMIYLTVLSKYFANEFQVVQNLSLSSVRISRDTTYGWF